MPKRRALKEGLALVFQGIEHLKAEFPSRKFTIDGRLVGDVGEVIAALEYDIELDKGYLQRQSYVQEHARLPTWFQAVPRWALRGNF